MFLSRICIEKLVPHQLWSAATCGQSFIGFNDIPSGDDYETGGPSKSHLSPISGEIGTGRLSHLLPLCKRVLAARAFIQNCHQNLQMNGAENCKFLTRTLLRFDLLHNLVLDTTSFGINNILGCQSARNPLRRMCF